MAKRVALIAAGAILMIGGGALSAGGGAVLATVGTDSRISSGTHAASTPTSAFVTEQGDVSDHGTGVFGRPSLGISVTAADKPVFIGVGPAAAVDRYLAGAAVETVTDFEVRPFRLTTTRVDGTAGLPSPLDQTFWVEQASGLAPASANWKIRDGGYRVVVMNADGSPGVNVDGGLSVRVPHLSAIGASLLAGGLFVVFIGMALLVIGLRTKHEPYVGAAVPSQVLVS